MSRLSLTLLIPLYNELCFIQSEFEKNWSFLREWKESFTIEVRFCVWKSEESAATVIKLRDITALWSSLVHFEVLEGGECSPSVVGSLKVGLSKPLQSRYVLICPVDCSPTLAGLREAHAFILNQGQRKTTWAVFQKQYSHPTLPLRVSCALQNRFLAPATGLHCWTNLFVVRQEQLIECFVQKYFLEDLYANRELHLRFGRPHRFRSLAWVSSRRYLARGSLKQIFINCKTFLRYLCNAQDLRALRRSYESTLKP